MEPIMGDSKKRVVRGALPVISLWASWGRQADLARVDDADSATFSTRTLATTTMALVSWPLRGSSVVLGKPLELFETVELSGLTQPHKSASARPPDEADAYPNVPLPRDELWAVQEDGDLCASNLSSRAPFIPR